MPELPAVEKVALVLADHLLTGRACNVSACLTAGLAARQSHWAGRPLHDGDGLRSVASSHLPIIVLKADAAAMTVLRDRLGRDTPEDADVCLFPDYAARMHDANEYWACHQLTSHPGTCLLGIGLAGSKRWVDSLVGSLPVLR